MQSTLLRYGEDTDLQDDRFYDCPSCFGMSFSLLFFFGIGEREIR
jgi:hypothetical protein